MKPRVILLSISILLFLGCSKEFKNTKRIADQIKSKSIVDGSGNFAPPPLPSRDEWERENKNLLDLVEEYRKANDDLLTKRRKGSVAFSVSGAAVGLAGGIYGVADKSSDKLPAITSLVTGALTTVVSTFNLKDKIENASNCAALLEGTRISFKNETYPADNTLYIAYVQRKENAIAEIKKSKCFGR